jgi:hypothetical protein
MTSRIAETLGSVSAQYSDRVSPDATLRGVWLGTNGLMQLEVCELLFNGEPSIQTVRAAWKKRRGQRARPLIVFWEGDDEVLMTEPMGDPQSVAVLNVAASAARAIIERALRAPHREAVQAVLSLLERTQGSGGIAGFRNRNLLSTHFVTKGYQRHHRREWDDLQKSGAALRTESGAKLLRSLGYSAIGGTTFEFTDEGRPRVFAMVLPDGTPVDRSVAGPGDAPATRLLVEARIRGDERAIIVAGRLVRIYIADVTKGFDDIATASSYIELDLDIISNEWSGLLPLLFSTEAHIAKGSFDQLIEESSRYAVGLRSRFRERVYDKVVGGVAKALYEARGRRKPEAMVLYRATLRLLYQLLFVLYAEDRNLLPLGNSEYRRISLTQTLLSLERRRSEGKPFDARQTTLWDDLFRIFDAVRSGSVEWNIPAYNGGLFEPDLPGQDEAAFLHAIRVPNAALAPLLIDLAFDEDERERGKVDFGDLGVRHLGSLYEGLLEYSVQIADEDLAEGADGSYVPARGKDAIIVVCGEPYLTSPKGERKTSGSYYTPSFVVRRLIDNALLPTLEAHLTRVTALAPEAQWNAMLDFRVVDPAMGSGHFLVDALDAIADRLALFLRENPRISAAPVGKAREQITEIGREFGIESLGEGIGDFELLRRTVMRNCIYGVDLNPMAVELAKLGLWLHAFVPGLPLSYLGHNLRFGNALVGIVGNEIQTQLGSTIFGNAVTASLNEALQHARKLVALSDLSLKEIKASERAQEQIEQSTEPLRAAFDAYACRVFAIDSSEPTKRERERGKAALEQSDGLQQVLAGQVKGAEKKQIASARRTARELSALHWQLTFPEAFPPENPGFDVVIGNPPWEEVTVEELGFFTPFVPGIKAVSSQVQRSKIIASFVKRRPEVQQQFEQELERTEALRNLIGSAYELTQGGDPDLYRAFAERALNIVRASGAVGMVFPGSLAITDGPAPFRQRAFADHHIVIDFAHNSNHWIFDGVHQQYLVIAFSRRAGSGGVVRTAGPVNNLSDWLAMEQRRITWTVADLAKLSEGLEVPLIQSEAFALLFRKMVNAGQAFSAPVDGVQFKPWAEFHGTKDRKSGLLTEKGRGWPVYKGENFDLWTPEQGEPPFVLDPKAGIKTLQARRQRSDAWRAFPSRVLADESTLPPNNFHIMFRDATNRLNGRTMIACLVPPGRFATNKAPVLISGHASAKDTALRLGIMSSVPFDWLARRRVERNMNFFILNALPVPRVGLSDPRAKMVMELSVGLLMRDDRFLAFAEACDLAPRMMSGRQFGDVLAQIDALVASMYNLDADDLETIFSDFSLAAVSVAHRDAVQTHLAAIKGAGDATQ